jgi:cytoskeletal protein CcmA (bactofilin family)
MKMSRMRPQTDVATTDVASTMEPNYNRDMNTPTAAHTPSTAPRRSGAGSATIGQSIRIEGTVTGNENLTIDGTVRGKINLNGHSLVVGPNGHIEADLTAKTVRVEGQVRGNITAADKVCVASSGTVAGDLRAPRVALDDGASYTGHVDTSS